MKNTQYYPEIKHYVLSRIENSEDAKDLVQQVFLEYYQVIRQKNNIENHRAYLLGVARIKVADYYRQKKKNPKIVRLKPKIADNLSDTKQINTSDTKEITENVENLISKLPPKAKEAFKLRFIDHLSYEESAKKANCSTQIFYERFYKAIKIIRNILNS